MLFGCGGDRDPGKRALMGWRAAGAADRVYVTDDNPRSEAPAAIRRAILAGAPGAIEIGDRRRAIETAVAGLGPGDMLVIAGKGHETGQIVGDRTLPFDDAAVARDIVARFGIVAALPMTPLWTAADAAAACGGRNRAQWLASGVSIDSRTAGRRRPLCRAARPAFRRP